MRTKILCFLFLLATLFAPASSAFALNTNDFYFDSFTADYYLSKNPDNTSRLKVTETLTAIFPDYDQNHGITREIPRTNNGGKNVTAKSISSLNLSVTRNGTPEPFTIESSDDAFNVRIGSADSYVHGTQVYTLSYEFANVITDFDTYQELYWDTNGTGWWQDFRTLTARVHLSDGIADSWTGKSWCYVGSRGSNNQSRCTTTPLADGVEFTTKNLTSGENLTFDIELQPGSFAIPQPSQSVILAIITLLLAVTFAPYIIYIVTIIYIYRQTKLPKSTITPQYTPPRDLAVTEAAQLYNRKKPLTFQKSKVATLIELAVARKVHLIKTDGTGILRSKKWQIKILSTQNLTKRQSIVLQILNGGHTLVDGDIITIKRQSYSSKLERLSREYASDSHLKSSGYISKCALSYKPLFIAFITLSLSFFLLAGFELMPAPYNHIDIIINITTVSEILLILSLFTGFGTLIFYAARISAIHPTDKGLDIINYLSGLKYYMSLAETERIKFLQSVDGADTSPEGIVNLYEKLLPYAIIFGLEESWLANLNHYYETMPEYDHWYYGTAMFSTSDLRSFNSSASSSISSGSVDSSSSSSSSSSGGGGGGFSGGGGGGGGGGGW